MKAVVHVQVVLRHILVIGLIGGPEWTRPASCLVGQHRKLL